MLDLTHITPADVAAAMGITPRAVRMRAARENWRFETIQVRGGSTRQYVVAGLPKDVLAAVARQAVTRAPVERKPASTEQIASAWSRFDRANAKLKATAERRMRALFALEELVRSGLSRVDARNQVVAQLQRENVRGASVASLQRWEATVRGSHRGDWLALLLPQFVGRTAEAQIPVDAWDIFKADFLRLERPSASSCYDRLQRIATARGWVLPPLRTFQRRLDRQIPRHVQVLAREGEEALLDIFPAQRRDRTVFRALEAVNADGHTFDVFVRFPDGTVGRPVVIPFQDLYSGKILSRRIGQTESADLARLSFHDLVTTFGIPSHVWLDNGRGFASKMLTGGAPNRYRFKVKPEDLDGVIVRLGAQVHWATPYHGQAKPIERAFRDWADRIAKHPAFAGAYTGNSPGAKPENYGSRAVDFATFARVVDEEIAAHNARPGRRTAVCDGRQSFDDVFAASYSASPVTKATAEQLRHLLLATEAVTASARDGSITLAGNRYWCEALTPHAGSKVVVRFDADNLHGGTVQVYTLADQFIGTADCIAAVGFADTQAAKEHSRAKRQWRRAAKQQLEAERRMSAAEVADQMPKGETPPMPPARVIQPVFKPTPSPASEQGELSDEERVTHAFLERQLKDRFA
ncbi:MAG: Mu transposase C-terminal domain-containing protein [Xanthomonadaceae bacterium]|nr:Mu transposase C-terminal domain-containing protein [Xanthomonadaceae bacterium]